MLEMDLSPGSGLGLGISPQREMGAYEALWDEDGASFKTIYEKLSRRPDTVPSDLVEPRGWNAIACSSVRRWQRRMSRASGSGCLARGNIPGKLRDADHPIALLYYRGWWDLVNSRCIAVVGTRTPSAEGQKRARQLVTESLVEDDLTIVSGLAKGIDRIAHETAIEANGRTIAVIGTPISYSYPAENRDLQERIARDFLLISQVPVKRWQNQGPKQNRIFFPERNITMLALTEGTIIVEAGKTLRGACAGAPCPQAGPQIVHPR